jgi:hypothetical protein
MNRFAILIACLGLAPPILRAADSPGVPASPWHQEMRLATPTIPSINVEDCSRRVGTTTSERCRSWFGGIWDPIRRLRDRGAVCESCGRVSDDNFCGSCGSRLRLGMVKRGEASCRDRSCWDKLKAWACWRPQYDKMLPCFRPIPYHAPLVAYFPYCYEPTIPVGTGWGHSGCGSECSHAKCGPAGCLVSPDGSPAQGERISNGFVGRGKADGRDSRLAGALDIFRPWKAMTAPPPHMDVSEIAPGLRFAHPTAPPNPQTFPAGSPANQSVVPTTTYGHQAPATMPSRPPASQPLTRP